MTLFVRTFIVTSIFGCMTFAVPVAAQTAPKSPEVHFIWMGGNDCPPCVAWRAFELPKLEQSPEFKLVKFSYVIKAIRSPVPSRIFLPPDVKVHKEALDEASSGLTGSPHAAVIVDGKVFDYFRGARSAEDIEKMLLAVRTGAPYPFLPCVKASRDWQKCETVGELQYRFKESQIK